jgi:hypothetical protein
MERPTQPKEIREGFDVIASDGDKLGKVIAVGPDHFVVEKGLFFRTDYDVPLTAIASVDGEEVHLLVTKEEALHQGWKEPEIEEELGGAASAAEATTGIGFTTGLGAVIDTEATGYVPYEEEAFDEEVGDSPPERAK